MKPIHLNECIVNQLNLLPEAPGVYIFKNKENEIIYIGKALNLKTRVRSYWNQTSWTERPKLAVLVPKIVEIENIVTNSEKEALLLEATLVRKHMPRYNVHLKDDKKYPWLCLTYGESFPRLIMVRDPLRAKKEYPKAKLFGPYVEAGAMWETVRVLRKVFPMRQRRKPLFKDRPCMNYHIGLCLGPCQNLVEESFYMQMVQQVEFFLSGSQNKAISEMEKAMLDASEALRYEEAAKIRDRLSALRNMLEKQEIFFKDQSTSLDIISEAHSEKQAVICLMKIREGKLIGSESFSLNLIEKTNIEEAYQAFIEQYYNECEDISVPKELVLEHNISVKILLEEILTQKSSKPVKITLAKQGQKRNIILLAKKNAQHVLDSQIKEEHGLEATALAKLTELKELLELNSIPLRIECFDISNIQGTDNVASMVVFEKATAKKSDYRIFKIKSIEGKANDFASMKEVVKRHFQKIKEQEKNKANLVIIDGGKGQLNAALEALSELDINDQDIVGLAKKQEEIYKPGRSQAFLLDRRSEALRLLQRIRDEAHRFAITYHRKLRSKRSLKSGFDELPGVGKTKQKILMTHFISFHKLQEASLEELKAIPGISESTATKIFSHLHPPQK